MEAAHDSPMVLRDDGRRARRRSFHPAATNEGSRATANVVPAIFFRSASGSSGRSAWLLFSGGDELLGSREHRRPRNSNPTGTSSPSLCSVDGSREAGEGFERVWSRSVHQGRRGLVAACFNGRERRRSSFRSAVAERNGGAGSTAVLPRSAGDLSFRSSSVTEDSP